MTTLDHIREESTWDAPGPGSWHQDRAHFPASVTPTLQAIYPDGNAGTVDWTASLNMLAIESPSERRVDRLTS